MIYEFREYHPVEGRSRALADQWENHTMNLYKKHGIEPVGFFWDVIGDQGLICSMLAYPDMGAREKSRAAFAADPEWQEVEERYVKENGDLYFGIKNTILIPYEWSPMH